MCLLREKYWAASHISDPFFKQHCGLCLKQGTSETIKIMSNFVSSDWSYLISDPIVYLNI